VQLVFVSTVCKDFKEIMKIIIIIIIIIMIGREIFVYVRWNVGRRRKHTKKSGNPAVIYAAGKH